MDFAIHIPDITNTLHIRYFHIRGVEAGWSYQNHSHRSFELLHCRGGSVTQWLDERPMPFRTGDWLLIPPGMKHRTHNQSDFPFTYLSLLFDIDDPDFRRELKTLPTTLTTGEEAVASPIPAIMAEMDALIHRYQVTHPDNDAHRPLSISEKLGMQALILQLVRHVIMILRKSPQGEIIEQTATAYEVKTATRIEQLIVKSLNDPDLSVHAVARKAGMSRSRCTKLFTKIFGLSPRQYITSQRLTQAKEKLIHSDDTIDCLARELGFSSLSHFSRQFKRWTGISPLQYRPKHGSRRNRQLHPD